MNTRLKADIEEAMQSVLNEHCDDEEAAWDQYIHPTLVRQMMNAAEMVFDSAQDAQYYSEQQAL